MIAVDTTVLADLLFNDGNLRRAANLLQEIDPEWICLGLVRYELGNVAWKMARLCGAEVGGLDEGLTGAEEAISEFVDDVDSPAVLRIAVESGLTFYDAAMCGWLDRGDWSCERAIRRCCGFAPTWRLRCLQSEKMPLS